MCVRFSLHFSTHFLLDFGNVPTVCVLILIKFFWSLYHLSFESRLLITPLVTSATLFLLLGICFGTAGSTTELTSEFLVGKYGLSS